MKHVLLVCHSQTGQDVGCNCGQTLCEWVDGQQERLLVSCGEVSLDGLDDRGWIPEGTHK